MSCQPSTLIGAAVSPDLWPLLARASANCEARTGGVLAEPASAVTSLAFVVAGLAVAVGRRGARPARSWFAALLVATGVGSAVQHGGDVPGADLVHDLPLVALIAFVAVDAARELFDRGLGERWWLVPTAALVPVIVGVPRVGDGLQAVVAVVAVALSVRRAWTRPAVRRATVVAFGILAVGGAAGTLSRRGWPLCESGLLVQGHAVWHVLAAVALWVYASALSTPRTP